MSKIEVNAIEPQCGTNLTVGASGDTITFPSGTTVVNNGSQTGFGRTGTVDWQTGSIKTSTFTAANGEGYFANTSGGAFVMNLPAGTAGNIVSVVDYTNTFQTNNLTVTPNGSQKIGATNASATLATEGQSVTFVYVDDTEGWKNVQDSTSNVIGQSFISATGGTITTCGDYKIHTFTGPGTFCVSSISTTTFDNTIGYLVVAGGGGAGGGGGGGAGGFREGRNGPMGCFAASPLVANAPTNAVTLTAAAFPITVGAGAAAQGSNSIFSTITSAGGGGGVNAVPNGPLNDGGSGGGTNSPTGGSGGSGNTPPVSPPQGNDGGSTGNGGGGGATAAGANGSAPTGGAGGAGATSSINGTPTARAGGGGGSGPSGSGSGGVGGGGAGGNTGGTNGTANTGGGGGANWSSGSRGSGGSGIVIIRYKFQ
jgi:hypothetical protein